MVSREPTNRQIDNGTTLTSKVRELMVGQMVLAGWSVVGELERKNIWQHSSRVTTSSASDQGDQAAPQPSRIYKVYGSKEAREAARESGAAPAYTRVVSLKTITFPCARCANTVVEDHLPGAKPQYCKPCSEIVRREKALARVKNYYATHPEKRTQQKQVN